MSDHLTENAQSQNMDPLSEYPDWEQMVDLDEEPAKPKPKSKGRSPIMMLAVIGFSTLLGFMFWEDLQYFLHSEIPVNLGNSEKYYGARGKNFVEEAGLKHNSYVTLGGLASHPTMGQEGIVYFKFAYVPVIARVEDQPNRFMTDWVHYTLSGRLVSMDSSHRYDGIKRHFRGLGVNTRGMYLLMADIKPKNFWYVPILFALFAMFVSINLFMLIRRFMKSR